MTHSIVTGAPGWLGTRLVHSLSRGVSDVPALGPTDRITRCLVLPDADASELEALGAEIVRGDVTDPGSLAKLFDGAAGATVFHAAGIVHPTRGVSQWRRVNADGTRNMLAAARAANIRRFVHVSSNSPLGTNPSTDRRLRRRRAVSPVHGLRQDEDARRASRARRDRLRLGDRATAVVLRTRPAAAPEPVLLDDPRRQDADRRQTATTGARWPTSTTSARASCCAIASPRRPATSTGSPIARRTR